MNRRKFFLGTAGVAAIPVLVTDIGWEDGIDKEPWQQFTLRKGGFGHLRSIGQYPTNPNNLQMGQLVTYDRNVGGAAGYHTRLTTSEKIVGVIAHATPDSFVVCCLDG